MTSEPEVVREEPPVDLVMAGLERVLASREFSASGQLSRFLRFLVESRFRPESGTLKESLIGVTVFRRGAAYDPKIDPIVRVEARRLRARLDLYYAGQGNEEPVRITLPKGGYTPIFEFRKAHVALPVDRASEVVTTIPATEKQSARSGWHVKAVAVMCAAACLGISVIVALAEPERAVHHFWRTILDSGRPALIVPADSGLVMLQDMTHQPASLREYITGEYRARLASGARLAPQVEALGDRRYTSIADLDFCTRLVRRPEAARIGVRTRYARELRREELRANNVILLGARHSNPWVELFEPDAAFRIEHDEATGYFRIVTAVPLAGEKAEIVISPAELRRQIYGVISYHRNREGSGVALTLGGTSVTGTEAAAALLLDDEQLRPWLRKAERNGKVFGFDLLIRDRNLGGGATRAEVIGFRADTP